MQPTVTGEASFLSGGGDMGELIRSHDWSDTPLRSPQSWPQSLKSALSICLHSSFPTAIYWGPELRLLYNDAWSPIPAERHPWALGRPAAEVWSDIWDVVGPQFEAVLCTGEGFSAFDQLLAMQRNGRPQETYWNYSFTPIRGEDGVVVGILNQGNEVTQRVFADRRQRFLLGLTDRLRDLAEPRAIIKASQEELGRHLGANRVGYGEVDVSERWFTTEGNWTDGSVPSRHGTHDLAGFGPEIHGDLRAGTPLLVLDVARDPRTNSPEALAAFEAIDTRAAITASLVKEARMRAALYVHASEPRAWTASDVEIVQAVAERTWAAVERARAEQDLKASEARLRLLNETLAEQVAERTAERDRIWRYSQELLGVADPQGRWLSVNPAWLRVLGWSEADIVGRTSEWLEHPEDQERTREEVARLAEGETTLAFENRFRKADGGYAHLSWTAVPEGGLLYCTARDVTAERARQAELEVAQEHLRQTQKLEAIGQLTGGVAHDFNNLLTVIRGTVDLLRRPDLADEKRARYIDSIGATADRAAKLTSQLLAFARRQALTPTLFDVGQSLSEVADMAATLTGSRIQLELAIPTDRFFIMADRNQFETAIVNMMINARDAMHGEGRLTVAAGPVSGIPAVRSHPPVAGEFVAVTIADTGDGIAPDDLARIFEPFFTTKAVGEGTGLGLSQVFGFAKQSGGEIRVDSVRGEGTTFTLYLPRAKEGGEVADEQPRHERIDGNGACVLVVEDNAKVGAFATDALRELGYRSVLAHDAEAALEELERNGEHIDVVFSDVVMPGMNGLELGTLIRRSHPRLPVILTSGYSHVLAQNGDHGFELLHKPYSIEQLSRVLLKAVAFRAGETECEGANPGPD